MNNKILMISYLLIFLATALFSNKLAYLRIQDFGQIFGLGGVVVGYFVTKLFKKQK